MKNKVTIYHNPACGTSRKVLERLQQLDNVDLNIIEYLKTPPSREQISKLLNDMNISARELIRDKQEIYTTLGLEDHKISDSDLIGFMAENPILINRPIVITNIGTRLCRPAEKVEEIIS